MPETKLTWKKLKEHFRKYFLIYIIGCVIAVVLGDLLYTITSPRTPEEKVVRFYIVDEYTESGMFDERAQTIMENLQAEGQDIVDVCFESLNYADAESEYYSDMLLMVRMAGGDGDVYLCNRQGYEYVTGSEVAMELDTSLANGWLEGMDVQTEVWTNEETGESFTAAIVLSGSEKLRSMGFFSDPIYVVIAANGTNIESTLMAAEDLIAMAME